ncbi:hypothetical protein KAR91_27985, partial [Candidatus Pacearchaeota archaeon]|nr:hypothetical protein [Candidatus Pacearchaeota archaeon]
MRIFLCVLALTLFAPIAKAQGFPQIKVFETTECTWLPAADGDKGQWVHFFSANELLKQLYEKKGVKGKLSDAALSHLSNTGLSLSKIELRNSPSVGTFASCTPATAVEK